VGFFEDPRFQDMLARVQANTARHFSQFVTNCLGVATSMLQMGSLVVILVAIEPVITLILLPLTFPYLVARWRLAQSRYEKEYTRATKRRWTYYFVTQVTDQKWVPEVKLLGLAPVFIERFRTLMAEFRDQDRRLDKLVFGVDFVFAIGATIALYGILVRIIGQVLAGVLTVGDVAIYAGATNRLRIALQNVVTSSAIIREGMLYISTLDKYLSIKSHIAQTAGLKPGLAGGIIECKNVSFTYPGSRQPVLTDVSFRIEPGETIALVGENGAGKTTLAKLLARLYDPTDGCILVDNVDLRELPQKDWHDQIGFVFQSFGFYEATAADNISFGDWQRLLQDRDSIIQIAELANVHRMIEDMPQGYDTFLGRFFGEYTISQGQWQRLAVARAFARENASLLILDEPTSNLDARAEYDLFCRFQELAAGRTTVLISHRFSTVSMADRILVLDDGRIVEQGRHQDLLARGGYYASLYRLHERQMVLPIAGA
jgi:ATP-binding cassette subfamily B protein